MNLTVGAPLTIALLAGNGFFVAAEFALVAAKRPRLEKAATAGSRGAASAVSGIRELSLMLAGAQLGITMCSLGLGLVSEPVIADTISPGLELAGLPEAATHGVAFVLALAAVTFLHMVIGEMAPKSWAISRPERAAILLAPLFRGFTTVVRPVLAALNAFTNLMLVAIGVQPRETMTVSRTPEQLRHLVAESRRLGLIEETDRDLLDAALGAPLTPLADMIIPADAIVAVPVTAEPDLVIETANRTGKTRILLRGPDGEPAGMVHVREAYLARAHGKPTPAGELAHPVPTLAIGTPVAGAVAELRAQHSQLALVRDGGGRLAGLISLDDLLTTLLAPA